jgi:antitoxin VapB
VPPSTSTASSAEAAAKREAVLDAASRRGIGGVVATHPSTVRWLLCGRGRPVVEGTASYTLLVGSGEPVVLFPDNESSRVTAEERFEELGYRTEPFPWYEGPDAALADLAAGYASDADLEGEIAALRRELRPEELARYRRAAQAAAEAMVETVGAVEPSWTELDTAAELGAALRKRGFGTPVLLVAGESRQGVHRHPLPTGSPLGRHALLATSADREGLYVSLTRLVSFGPPPPRLERVTRISAEVDAAMLAASRPGTPVNQVLRAAADAYERLGFPEEWRRHHQGGIAGYAGREVIATPADATPLPRSGAVAWNPSVTGGGKSEDTALVGAGGPEILTRTPELAEVEIEGLVRPAVTVR